MPKKPTGKIPQKTNKKSAIGATGKLGTNSGRKLTVRVKKAKKMSVSSARWLARQLNDPYVHAAKRDGYRSRAAYKLLQLDEKFELLKTGMRIVDLGAAPGGWTQVISEKVFKQKTALKIQDAKNQDQKKQNRETQIIALDILPMEPLTDVVIFHCDFTTDEAPAQIRKALRGKADLVLSDMAAPTTGHNATDHLRIIGLAELAYDFARSILAPKGAFVCKLFQGGADKDLLATLKKDFAVVKHAKPAASRTDSAETYIVAQGFRGTEN
jgi:23S rRNA (uridine2552-2'-O)-methyltransferase